MRRQHVAACLHTPTGTAEGSAHCFAPSSCKQALAQVVQCAVGHSQTCLIQHTGKHPARLYLAPRCLACKHSDRAPTGQRNGQLSGPCTQAHKPSHSSCCTLTSSKHHAVALATVAQPWVHKEINTHRSASFQQIVRCWPTKHTSHSSPRHNNQAGSSGFSTDVAHQCLRLPRHVMYYIAHMHGTLTHTQTCIQSHTHSCKRLCDEGLLLTAARWPQCMPGGHTQRACRSEGLHMQRH
jgi:hypothetical protein